MPREDSIAKSLHVARRASLRDQTSKPATRESSQPYIPVEIVEQIALECIGADRSFAALVGMSSASRLLRGIVLRVFFRHTRMLSTVTAQNMIRIPGLSRWIRHLSLNNQTVKHLIHTDSVLKLRDLSLISLDIQPYVPPTTSALPDALIDGLPSTLRDLRITSLAHIGPAGLAGIARTCKALEELELSVVDALRGACCWQCFGESESRVVHSPVMHGRWAQTLEQVIDAYADALRPLPRLRRLALGVFLSPAAVLTTHLDLHRADSLPYATEGTPAYDVASAQHTPAAARSPHFKMSDYHLVQAPPAANIRDHVARFGLFATPSRCKECVREYSESVRKDELHATVRLAQRLKGLESVWWSSWFSGDNWQGSTGAMWTRLSVAREGMRLKVARQRRV
ncbi:hypothetical protein PENSPDRAFT_693480 [Peniophora sp. CONT]|nr:hypothetical protein PENSPDRAFT_693480 [Peniophora sp. CONT]